MDWGTEGRRSFFATVSDDVILDAVVDFAGHYAAIDEVLLGAIGAKSRDTPGPGCRHAGNFGEPVDTGVVDVDARLGPGAEAEVLGTPFVSRS